MDSGLVFPYLLLGESDGGPARAVQRNGKNDKGGLIHQSRVRPPLSKALRGPGIRILVGDRIPTCQGYVVLLPRTGRCPPIRFRVPSLRRGEG